MSASGGTKAIIAAFLANTGIALTKFIAWFFSGSSSMLAEAVHSVADAGNQLLLIFGGRQAKKEADKAHPFGYGRERYVYAFVVSIILFSVGGIFSIYEGIDKLQHPHELEVPWLPILVLSIAIVLESFSLRTAVKESNHVRGRQSWVQFVRHAKAPELPVVLLEDIAALLGLVFAFIGVGLTILTGDPLFDAIGTLFIGALLIVVAVVLGIETKSLLVGEGATDADHAKIEQAILAGPEADRIIHMKTLYLGPDELMVGAKVGFHADQKLLEVSAATNAIETRIRQAVPTARVIYVEPDGYPSLADEIRLLESRVTAEAPVFGVCLGAQLLAKTLGARVYQGPRKEVGWLEVEPTAAGADSPVRHFAGVPTVQWHGDSFELPEGVERLASSPQYENQAFRIGEWLLAVQFHPEVTDEIHEEWLREWGDELPEYGLTREQLREQRASYGPAANAASAALLGEYLEGLTAREAAERRSA